MLRRDAKLPVRPKTLEFSVMKKINETARVNEIFIDGFVAKKSWKWLGFGVVDWTASLQDLQLVSLRPSEGFFADF